jgi:hypothetical protein
MNTGKINCQDAKVAKARVEIVFIRIKNLGALGALAVKPLAFLAPWRLKLKRYA